MSPRFLSVLSGLFLVSCASSTDMANDERVRGYVGRTIALRRPMLLVEHAGYFFGGANDVMSRRPARYGLTAPGTFREPRVFAELPAGHRVTIDAIDEETCFDAYQTVVYGRTIFPRTGQSVSFAYVCAPLIYLRSESLPWEE